MKGVIFAWLLLFLGGSCVNGARILGVFHAPAPSHFILGGRLMKELAARGHQVTMISSYPLNKPLNNYNDVPLLGLVDIMEELKKEVVKFSTLNPFQNIANFNRVSNMMTEYALNHTNVQKLLESKEKFDLVIMESFMNEAHLGFGYHFNAPVIILSTIGANSWINWLVNNPAPYSYSPEVILNYLGTMNFQQRLTNTVVGTLSNIYTHLFRFPEQNELLHKYFPNAPDIQELSKRVSLILLNSHVSLSPAKPHVPSMVEIGGFHVEEPKELPKDLKDYLDGAKEGFILFSMGSNLKSANMPPEFREAAMKVFAKLPYKILWKFEVDDLPGKPDNVKISKWLPQNDILAHPNIRLFITHGGLLSTTEAVYHGVPVVGIPVFGDQKTNMATAEKLGMGIGISFTDINTEILEKAVTEVLSNPKYRENIRERSKIMRDQPIKPIDSAMWWIEYILRHKEAKHLKTAAMELEWYQIMLLDVLAVLAGGTLLVLAVSYWVIKKLLCLLCRLFGNKCANKTTQDKKKKQ